MATTATSTEWARVVNTTTRQFLKGEEVEILRNRKLLKKIQSRGGVKYNQSGDGVQWQVRKARGQITVNNGAQSLTFGQQNRHIKCFLDYQGYVIAEAMYEREKLKNRSTAALVDVWGNLAKWMADDLQDQFAEELYVDDSATGNTGRVGGIESMMVATQTINESTTTSTAARTANAADRVYYPNDTYAGVSTILGNEGGSWNANWPQGKGDAEFDYFSPLIINGGSSAFDGTSTTWTLNARRAIQFALIHANKNVTTSGKADLALFDRNAYDRARIATHAAERFTINQGGRDQEYGTDGDSIWIDGCEVTYEYGIPTNVGYGFNTQDVEVLSMYDTLFHPQGPYEDEEGSAWRLAVRFMGQLKFGSPRNFIKWKCDGTGTI